MRGRRALAVSVALAVLLHLSAAEFSLSRCNFTVISDYDAFLNEHHYKVSADDVHLPAATVADCCYICTRHVPQCAAVRYVTDTAMCYASETFVTSGPGTVLLAWCTKTVGSSGTGSSSLTAATATAAGRGGAGQVSTAPSTTPARVSYGSTTMATASATVSAYSSQSIAANRTRNHNSAENEDHGYDKNATTFDSTDSRGDSCSFNATPTTTSWSINGGLTVHILSTWTDRAHVMISLPSERPSDGALYNVTVNCKLTNAEVSYGKRFNSMALLKDGCAFTVQPRTEWERERSCFVFNAYFENGTCPAWPIGSVMMLLPT